MWEPSDWIALAALFVTAISILAATRNSRRRIEADKDLANSQMLEDRRTRYIEDAYERLPQLASLLERVSWDSFVANPPEPEIFEFFLDQSRPAWERSAELVAHINWFQQFGWTKDIREAADEVAAELQTIYTSIDWRRWTVAKRSHPSFGDTPPPLTDDEVRGFNEREMEFTQAVEDAEKSLDRLAELIRES